MSTPSTSLADTTIELLVRTLLLCKRLKEEVGKGVLVVEFESLKKELDYSRHLLQFALHANTTLEAKLKEISYVHSQCDAKKNSLKEEIVEMVAERLSMHDEIENLHRGLSNMSLSK